MIPSETTDLIVAQSTHEGETGKNNEDRAVVGAFRDSTAGSKLVNLAMVADGIGGHAAGEIASDLAVRTVYDHLERAADSRDPLGVVEAALLAANRAIYERSRSEPQLQGMGSTAVVALIVGRRLYAAHVGDSRMYLIRGGAIQQLTVDHTWVQEAITAGLLTPEDARKHPNRHVIRRYLGHDLDVSPVDKGIQSAVGETREQMERNQGMMLHDGDMLLLCSDGLTDLVEDREILSAVMEHSPQAATEQLVLLARQRGGFDNITVVLVKAPERPRAAAATTRLAAAPTKRPRRRSRALVVGIVVVAALLVLAAIGGVVALLLLSRAGNPPAAAPPPAATAVATQPPSAATVGAALPPGEATPTETPTPEASETPGETATATQAASETPDNQAFVTANVDTAVRFGPDPNSSALGDLLAGSTAKVYGRDPDGLWWYVDFPPGTASRGWVFQAATTLTGDVNTIPVVNAVGTPVSGNSSGTGDDGTSTGPTGTPQG